MILTKECWWSRNTNCKNCKFQDQYTNLKHSKSSTSNRNHNSKPRRKNTHSLTHSLIHEAQNSLKTEACYMWVMGGGGGGWSIWKWERRGSWSGSHKVLSNFVGEWWWWFDLLHVWQVKLMQLMIMWTSINNTYNCNKQQQQQQPLLIDTTIISLCSAVQLLHSILDNMGGAAIGCKLSRNMNSQMWDFGILGFCFLCFLLSLLLLKKFSHAFFFWSSLNFPSYLSLWQKLTQLSWPPWMCILISPVFWLVIYIAKKLYKKIILKLLKSSASWGFLFSRIQPKFNKI
jgi:hypothetical protein